MATRIGIDIGGTFTDLIFYNDELSEVTVAKTPTTPGAPEEGAINAIVKSLTSEHVKNAEYFLHGTTVGLNALLERRGAKVGLLATSGFRDVLEIRRGSRQPKDPLFWRQPDPLVPRELRLPISERIYANGGIHIPLCKDDVRNAAHIFEKEGVTSVAIAFINSYVNPDHELEAEQLLRDAGYKGGISLSHRISREYREFERTSTTVIDAFVRGRMSQYLRRLENRLGAMDFVGTGLITRSGGGSMSLEEAERRPFETIMSGPVAGAEGAAELARQYDLGNLLTADVGGTSFDTCMIVNGRPELLYEGEIDQWPLQSPWVDVRSIGSGGGSIAYIDHGGLLRVGPQSAGATPGPACYGRGGREPTMTDAASVLGMLGDGKFQSGLELDIFAARTALDSVAKKLDLTVEQLAQGIIKISASAMANAMRELTVERGIDPSSMSLLAFGGAGPLMSTLLSRELNIARIIIPPYAGNFSAWGLLGADITSTRSQTRPMSLTDAHLVAVNDLLTEMFTELDLIKGLATDNQSYVREVTLDMRYVGQEHTITVQIENEDGQINLGQGRILALFEQKYLPTFGGLLSSEVEIVSVRATQRRPLPRRQERMSVVERSAARTAKAYSFMQQKELPFQLVERAHFKAGEIIQGPAIINESTTTTYLDAGYKAEVDISGCLFITASDVA